MRMSSIITLALGLFFFWAGLCLLRKKDTTLEDIQTWRQQYPTATARITGTYRSYNYESGRHSSYYHYKADIWVNGMWCKADGVDSFRAEKTCERNEEVAVAYRPIAPSKLPKEMETLAHGMLRMVTKATLGAVGVGEKVMEDMLQFEEDPRYQFKILDADKFRKEREAQGKPDGGGIFFLCFGALILLITILGILGIVEQH